MSRLSPLVALRLALLAAAAASAQPAPLDARGGFAAVGDWVVEGGASLRLGL